MIFFRPIQWNWTSHYLTARWFEKPLSKFCSSEVTSITSYDGMFWERTVTSHPVLPPTASVFTESWRPSRGRHRCCVAPHLGQPGRYAELLFGDFNLALNRKLTDWQEHHWIVSATATCLWIFLLVVFVLIGRGLKSKSAVTPHPARVCLISSRMTSWVHFQLLICSGDTSSSPTSLTLSPLAAVSRFSNIDLGDQDQVEQDVRIFRAPETSPHLNGDISKKGG